MVATFIGRLRRRLGGGNGADASAKWRARAAEVTALAAKWRSRYETLRVRSRARERALQAQNTLGERRTPSVEALRHALLMRLPLARHRAQQPAARARQQRFAAASADYQRAQANASALAADARSRTVDGLTWWIPAPPTRSAAAIERTIQKQKFPYRSISLARDLAIGGIMLDVGANIGAMAIPRVALGDFDVVYCAEPDDLNYRCLVANVTGNGLDGLVIPDCLAISDRIGAVSLHRGKAPGAHRVIHEAGADPATSVRSMTLDAWADRLGLDFAEVTFVKVDTQGSEVRVLAGAPRLLAQPQIAWQLEVAPWLLRLAGSPPEELYRLLQQQFTHFMDLNAEASGRRLREIGELDRALAYLEREAEAHTDVVVYRASATA